MTNTTHDEVPDGFVGFLDDSPEDIEQIHTYEKDGERIRLVAAYGARSQQWMLRKQVQRDGDWRTSSWGNRLPRNGPNDHPDRVPYLKNRYVRENSGVTSDVSVLQRFIWALQLFVECLRGMDANIQYLHDPEWSPEDE